MPQSNNSLQSCLIVDDHDGMRTLLRELLPDATNQVWECGNGAEAVETYERERPDLVLMDISMPVMNGIEATREIIRRHRHANIVIVTNHEDATTREASTRSGAKACLSKSELSKLPGLIQSLP